MKRTEVAFLLTAPKRSDAASQRQSCSGSAAWPRWVTDGAGAGTRGTAVGPEAAGQPQPWGPAKPQGQAAAPRLTPDPLLACGPRTATH